MGDNVAGQQVSSIDFAELKLRAGAWLQLHSVGGEPRKVEVEFAAALHGKSLFVAMADGSAGDIRLKQGERYLVRGFNGVRDFSFTSEVLEIQAKPFVHAHLIYPDVVESKVVREAVRVQTSLNASVTFEGLEMPVPAQVKNLSVIGALIGSAVKLGVVGDRVEVRIPTQFEQKATELKISALIRHVNKSETEGAFKTGVEFLNVSQNDKLVLYYLLFNLSENER